MTLPLCQEACGRCDKWRPMDAVRRTLREAVDLALSMRDAGWRPHECPQSWDRSELSLREHALSSIPPHLTRQVRLLEEEAALPQHRPLCVVPDGGVRIASADIMTGLEGTVGPATRTTAANRAAIYTAVVADVASGVLERGDVRVLGRIFVGPKSRALYDAEDVNNAIPQEERTVRYGSVADLVAADGKVAVKLDLKSAFKSVDVDVRDRPLLGVEVDGVTLRHAKLPFGLATSPRLFVEALQRTMSKVALPEGTTAICYVDDIADQLDAFKDQIISGEITVPTAP